MEKESRVVLSFVDETFISWSDYYIPDICIVVVACEFIVELSAFVRMI